MIEGDPLQSIRGTWGTGNQSPPDYTPSEEESEHVKYVTDKVNMAEDARRRWVGDVFENCAFVKGRQWANYNWQSGRLIEPNVDPWQKTMVLNYILPAVRTAIGKLNQGEPDWIVVPRDDSEEEAERARASQLLLDALHQMLDVSVKSDEFVFWMLTAGIGIFRVWFDPESTVASKMIPKGQPGSEPGFPAIQAVSPLQVLFDPGCEQRDLSDCQWAAEVCYVNIDQLRERYEKAQYITPTATYGSDPYGMMLQTQLNQITMGASADKLRADRVRVVYYYERPSRKRPDGLYAIVCEKLVLHEDVLPMGMLPFAIARHNAVGGQLVGDGMVTQLKPVQVMVNQQVSVRLEIVELNGTPKLLVEEGSIGQMAFSREPGELVMYSRGSRPPEAMPAPPVSPEYEKLETSGIGHIREISGVNEVSQGIGYTNLSGRAAQRLAELDATKFGPTTKEMEAAMEQVAFLLLNIVRENMPESFMLRLLGRDRKPEVMAFEKEAITSMHVRVAPGSMRVRHPSVERENLMMAAERGMLGNMQDPDVLAELRRALEFGDPDLAYGQVRGETTYAREENMALLMKQPVEAAPTDDHQAHIREHRAFGRTEAVRNADPEVFFAATAHIAEHEVYQATNKGMPIPPWCSLYVPDLIASLTQPPPGSIPPGEEGTGMPEQPGGEDEPPSMEEPGEAENRMMRPTAFPMDSTGGVELGGAPPINIGGGMNQGPQLPVFNQGM